MEGWIKIHRSILEWEWFDDPFILKVWLYLLLSANTESKRWCGVDIKRGQLATSEVKLAEILGMNRRTIRRALEALVDARCILKTFKNGTDKKCTIITIKKYNDYQVFQDSTCALDAQVDAQQDAQVSAQVNAHNLRNKEYKNIISSSTAHTHVREIEIDKIPEYIASLTGTQQYESIHRELYRLNGNKMATREELESLLAQFVDELHIQGMATHEEKDICRHFVQWARIALPKINRNNDKKNEEARANRNSDSRESIIDSYKRSIIKDLQESGNFTDL